MTRPFTISLLFIIASLPAFACQIKVKFTDWKDVADMQKRLTLQTQDGKEIELKGTEGEFSFERLYCAIDAHTAV